MVKRLHCMILFETLQKTKKNTNRFLKNPAKRPKLYLTTPPKTKFYRDVYSFSSKSGWSTNLKNQKLKNPKIHVYKTIKTSTKDRQTNQPLFEESNKTNRTFALQYPPKVHLSRDVYLNSAKKWLVIFSKNTQT